jgi:hypothetical protein
MYALRTSYDTEKRSRDHCCHRRSISKKNYEFVSLYSYSSYSACKAHVLRAALYCHLWPVWLYHIILSPVACLAVSHYTVTFGLSGCITLYCHLWPVWLYHIILSCVAGLAVSHYTVICGLSGCITLYCHLWPVWLYHIILSSVACLAVSHYTVICGLSDCITFSPT